MTVGELRCRMSQGEYVQWGTYFARLAQQRQLAALKAGGGNGGQ